VHELTRSGARHRVARRALYPHNLGGFGRPFLFYVGPHILLGLSPLRSGLLPFR